MDSREERITSETGGSKGQKLARFDLIPPEVMIAIAEQYGRGAAKYDDRNWERGYNWSLSYAAAQRHLHQFWAGESWDGDSEWADLDPPHHLDAAIFHLIALRYYDMHGDRYGKWDDREA